MLTSKTHILGQALFAVLFSTAVLAQTGAAVTFQPTDGGYDILKYGEFQEELDGANAYVAGTYGSLFHITAFSGGTLCPAFHYVLDVSGPSPRLSDGFGDCAESLSFVSAEAGKLVLLGETALGPKEFIYAGGEIVEAREVPLRTMGVSPDQDLSRLRNFTISQVIVAAEWEDKLVPLMGMDALNDLGFYVSGPSSAFDYDGDWLSSPGCARAMCSDRFAALSIRPSDGAIIVARYDGVSDGGLEIWGDLSDGIPDATAEVIAKSMDAELLRTRFNALSSNDRKQVQGALKAQGFYDGALDGAFGPKTGFGILAFAFTGLKASGSVPDFSKRADIDGVLAQLRNATIDQTESAPRETSQSGQFPFVGTWDCEGTALTLTRDTYKFGSTAMSPITDVEFFADDPTFFGLTLPQDYRVALFDVSQTSLTWHSPLSGDTFECVRMQ